MKFVIPALYQLHGTVPVTSVRLRVSRRAHNGLMASTSNSRRTKRSAPRGLLILLGLLLSAVLATINGLQVASLQRALEGLALPETQFFGYPHDYIEAVRLRMTDELLERYGAVHYLWDVLCPIVFAATLVLLAQRVARGRKIRYLYMAVPVLYAVVDIAENLALESLFNADLTTPEAVGFASTLTVLKGILFVLALVTALLTLATRPRKP
jgi:hypothetical protein